MSKDVQEFTTYMNALSEAAEAWDSLYDDERKVVSARMSLLGEEFADALDNKDEGRVWGGCCTMKDVAYEYVEECDLLHGVPDSLQHYFDYEAFGRDLEINGCFEFDDGEMVEVW